MEKNNLKLIALDMDGTLLTSDKRILPETVSDMEKAAESGCFVTLRTGRGIPEIKEYGKELAPVRYAVLESGSYIYDFAKKQAIYKENITRKLIGKIIDVAEELDGMLHYHAGEYCVVRKEQVKQIEKNKMTAFREMFLSVGTFETDMRGAALKYLDLSTKDVMVVGDSDNDKDMFAAAGFAVAMDNAIGPIKELADAVTADNNHNGIGEAIRNYLLIPAAKGSRRKKS